MNIITETFKAASEIHNGRRIEDALEHLYEEADELDFEIHEQPRDDQNIREEAVDVILCALDVIWLENPGTTEDEIMEIVHRKLEKWKKYYADSIHGTYKYG